MSTVVMFPRVHVWENYIFSLPPLLYLAAYACVVDPCSPSPLSTRWRLGVRITWSPGRDAFHINRIIIFLCRIWPCGLTAATATTTTYARVIMCSTMFTTILSYICKLFSDRSRDPREKNQSVYRRITLLQSVELNYRGQARVCWRNALLRWPFICTANHNWPISRYQLILLLFVG